MNRKRILMLMAGLVAVAALTTGAVACNDDEDDDDDGENGGASPTAIANEISVGDLKIMDPRARASLENGACSSPL